MLVDMAGSENIEQAGQNGLEAKMQVEYYLKVFITLFVEITKTHSLLFFCNGRQRKLTRVI